MEVAALFQKVPSLYSFTDTTAVLANMYLSRKH